MRNAAWSLALVTLVALPASAQQSAGSGATVVDDNRTTAAGRVVVSEDAVALTVQPGPLNFQQTEAIAVSPDASASVRSATIRDLDGDGYPELILTLTAPNPSTTPLAPIIVQ